MSTNHDLFEEKGEPKRFRTEVLPLTSLPPYGCVTRHHFFHHQNDSRIKMGSDESHLNISVGSDGQSRETVSTNHDLFEEKGEPKRYRTEVLPLTSLSPYGCVTRHHFFHHQNDSRIKMGSDESHLNISVGSDGQSRETVSTNHDLFEEKGEPKRYRTEVLPLTSLPPYRCVTRHHFFHHQNDSRIKMGSDESHLNISVGSDGQSRETASTNHNLFEQKGEPKRYRTEVLPLTSLPPYRCVTRHHFFHHQNDSRIKMGSDESHLNISVGSDGQSRETASTNHNLFEQKGEPKRYRTEVLPLTSLPPYRCVTRHHFFHHQNDSRIKMGSDESHLNISVGSDGQSRETASTNHNLFEQKGEPKRYRTEVLPLTSLSPYGCVTRHHFFVLAIFARRWRSRRRSRSRSRRRRRRRK